MGREIVIPPRKGWEGMLGRHTAQKQGIPYLKAKQRSL